MTVDARHLAFLGALMGCQRSLYAYILKLLPNSDEARDVLQKTNLLLIQKEDEFAQVRDFGGWAARHAYFQVLAHRKTRQRERLIFDDELVAKLAEDGPGNISADDASLEALSACMDKLPAGDRELIEQRYQDGHRVEGLAERLRRSAASVTQSLYRIRRGLLECIRRRLQAEGSP